MVSVRQQSNASGKRLKCAYKFLAPLAWPCSKLSTSIPLVAYCPLAQGRAASDATLTAIGRKHGASAAQVALKWLLDQDGVAAIPKASRPESQKANLDALKITLDDDDRKAIAALPKTQRFVNPGFAPAWD